MSIQLQIRRKQSFPYHGDGCAEGLLVVVQELKAGELADLTVIGAQSPLSKGLGAKSSRQSTSGCGVGSSGRMCHGGQGAHRGSGGSKVHCDNVRSCYLGKEGRYASMARSSVLRGSRSRVDHESLF